MADIDLVEPWFHCAPPVARRPRSLGSGGARDRLLVQRVAALRVDLLQQERAGGGLPQRRFADRAVDLAHPQPARAEGHLDALAAVHDEGDALFAPCRRVAQAHVDAAGVLEVSLGARDFRRPPAEASRQPEGEERGFGRRSRR